jgi:methyl-accepting chemotaxis protein
MTKTVSAFVCAALASIGITALVLAWTVIMLGHHVAFSMAKMDRVTDGVAATLAEIDRPCTVLVKGQEKSCGSIADVNQTLHTIRGTFGQIEVAARHENQNLKTLDRQEADLFRDLHATIIEAQGTLSAGTGTLKAMTATVETAQKSIAAAEPLIESSTRTIDNVNHSVDTVTPELHRFLKSSSDTMEQGALISTNVRKMSDHIEKKVDAPTHWYSPFVTYAPAAAKIIGNIPW